jgi:primary-amine oxidase
MAQHPLDSLTAEELKRTAEILRREGRVTDGWRFTSIELKEPEKSFVKAWRPGDPVPRTSFAILLNRAENKTYEATVDLTGSEVLSFENIPGVQPNFTLDEFHEIDEAMREHPDVIAALAARGYADMSLILIDTWAYAKALMPASVELARAVLRRTE